MIFQVGRYYAHEAGRQIAVLAAVETYKWGKMLVIEEADRTGHSISCAEIEEANDHNWVQIGREEWLQNFRNEPWYKASMEALDVVVQ